MKNNKKEVVLDLDLPGFRKEDINVKIGKKGLQCRQIEGRRRKYRGKIFFMKRNLIVVLVMQLLFLRLNQKKQKQNFPKENYKLKHLKNKQKLFKLMSSFKFIKNGEDCKKTLGD